MTPITITVCNEHDAESLAALGRQTFVDAFAGQNTVADMAHYLQTSFIHETIAREIREGQSVYHAARMSGNLVGYTKLNFGDAQSELKDPHAAELERIYVRKEYIGHGIGQQLINNVLAVAVAASLQYIWLGVWEHNQKAIRFYERQGFVPFSSHVFKLGNDEQTDILMKRMLR